MNWRRHTGMLLAAAVSVGVALGQSNGTGLLSGTVMDVSGALVAGATVVITRESTRESRRLTSNAQGLFSAPLLPAGEYDVTVSGQGFATARFQHVAVAVGSSELLEVHLKVGSLQETVIDGDMDLVIPPPANTGSLMDQKLVENLPLAARNYTQILGLSTGVAGEVTDAGSLGRGATSYSAGPGGFSSNGAGTNDNNVQMDGADVNDIQGSGATSRGVPVPNPDAIQEFHVSTQPYDASMGRNSGANIDVITRSGANHLHGSAFEYFRNDALNANTYFRKATGQPRGTLKQNQFGGSLGGAIMREKVFAFGSYQETRQSNGIDASCSSTVALPPLTDDRTAAGIGKVFAGQRGYFQNAFGGVGQAIAADGSNINPVALALLQKKGPEGKYLIPTPQLIVATGGNFDTRGLSSFSEACPYKEHQGVGSADWVISPQQKLSVHGFLSNSNTLESFPAALLGGGMLPSSPFAISDRFRTISVVHTWVMSPNLLNEVRFGFHRLKGEINQGHAFTFSRIGASVPSFDDGAPVMTIGAAAFGGSFGAITAALNTFTLQDTVGYVHGHHTVHAGGGITRVQDNQPKETFYAATLFLTFADFLLGQNAQQNGTAQLCAFAGCGAGYSDVAYSQDIPGRVMREYRVLSGNAYVQDDIALTNRLTLNVGLRWERLGDLADKLGHNTSFYPALANTNPPATGTFAGFVVPANYTGAVPAGVTRLDNNYGLDGVGQSTWQPRVAMAWQLPGTERLTLRGGYGLFRSRITADAYNQSVITPPFARLRQYQGTDPVTASLTLQQPVPAFTQTLPSFAPYCAPGSSACTESPAVNTLAPDAQPPMYHRYSVDLETRLARGTTLDLGYVGARGSKLLVGEQINQAGLASASNPIRGVTTNTLANLPLRVVIPGFSVPNLTQYRSTGVSLYNALDASVRRTFHGASEFLVSYTWARNLTDVYSGTTALHGGVFLGDQLHPNDYGRDAFIREHRLVTTFLWQVPSPKARAAHAVLGGWKAAGVVLAQSGHALTPTYQNQFSAYGVVNDRAQLLTGCAAAKSGSAEARLTAWFQTACYAKPAVIGADNVATGFGNAPIGALRGPRQMNVDFALSRRFPVRENIGLEVRAESFNLFNHAQFADPDMELSSATFGQVRSTAVNPRVLQLAARLAF